MSVKYQEHQFPLTIILPQSCVSHLSGDEVQHTERGAAGEQILQRSVSTPEKRHCRAEISGTDQPQSLDFTLNDQVEPVELQLRSQQIRDTECKQQVQLYTFYLSRIKVFAL